MISTQIKDKIILYGNHISQPSRSVMWFMMLNNIPFEFKLIRLEKLDHRSKSYEKINPMKQIPSLTIIPIENSNPKDSSSHHNGEETIFESQAILLHLFHRYRKLCQIPGHWYPDPHSHLTEHTKVNMYLGYHNSQLRPAVGGLAFAVSIGPNAFGMAKDETNIRQLEKKTHMVLKQLDTFWMAPSEDVSSSSAGGNARYLCGQAKISIADLLCYNELMQLSLMSNASVLWESEMFKSYPNVCKWLQLMSKTPEHDKVFKFLNILKEKSSNERTSKL
ncbi:hypothetical protein C9374_012846 [Naegleria lovaniensis]|uniref:Glutathione S-transferase n=1 Tax=Naegleria lovaniensis TaxID=51637 RepID=A0AA88KDP2_NAELO|nr:uncharacterized protein C9374_012846 [Naegleria lovaniensis]KAG2373114.1 hypothetical protein C9374_012846 [Naegleria lovaniensis]